MSSLQESAVRRKAAEVQSPECLTLASGQPGLIVQRWQGGSWVLPWSQFVVAGLPESADEGPLEIVFATHVVTLTGDNLSELLADVAAQRVARLRDLPAEYRPRRGEKTLFVATLEVRAVGDEPKKVVETPG